MNAGTLLLIPVYYNANTKQQFIILEKFSDIYVRAMNKATKSAFLLVVSAGIILTSCSGQEQQTTNWTNLIPAETPVAYTSQKAQPLDSVLTSDYVPFLDDITSSSARLISVIDSTARPSLSVQAIYLFPSTANQWKPVWITAGTASAIKRLQKNFKKQYTQNEYFFKDQRIQILHLHQRKVFVTKLGRWILLSENSLALEESIRSYTGQAPALTVNHEKLGKNNLILNTPHLDEWVRQLTQVTYRPSISGVFRGTEPIILDIGKHPSSSTKRLTLSGILPVNPNESSVLVESVTTRNEPFELDSHIPDQAAGYGIFHQSPSLAPPKSIPHPGRLDSLLLNNASLYQRIARSLHSEFAITMFSESGYLSEGEHFFMRRVSNKSQLIEGLEQLTQTNLQDGKGVFNINSRVLAQLIATPICTFDDFYAAIADDVLILSKRRGLTESLVSNWRRGRVINDQEMYQTIRKNMDSPLSGLFVAEGRPFLEFIEPYLSPNHYADALISRFDVVSMGFKRKDDQETAFQLNTYNLTETSDPYREKWAYALSGTELTGKPVLTDIGGSPRPEVIFATRTGNIRALASDGTEILQTNTETETPVGSPLVYDWYGNGQKIILQAAGNKIYGWNTRGNSLPQFPMTLEETIAAPPRIADVNRDGMPELMVTTSNRKIHVLNGRGRNINGWPRTTNSIINTSPVFKKIDQHWSVFGFAANTLHAWLPNGSLRPGYPKFIQATFQGQPLMYEDHVFGNAADGHLYAVSENPPFSDSLRILPQGTSESDSLKVTSLKLSDRGLIGSPTKHTLSLKSKREDTLQATSDNGEAVRDDYLLTASSLGTVYFLNTKGAVRQSYHIDQSLARDADPFINDLNQDGSPEVFVLSRLGRLFAWNLESGRRNFTLPTQSMKHPVIADIDHDGNLELIAQSQNGIRCWTLFNP